jgi:hypothetical protein
MTLDSAAGSGVLSFCLPRSLCMIHLHSYCCSSGGRCESVRTIIERVFGMLKKRFRILRLSMLVKDMSEVEDLVKVCCVLHNM